MDKYLDAQHKILNPHERTAEPAAGDRGYTVGRVRGVDKSKRQVSAVLSTPSVDRYGEIVLPTAFAKTLDQFKANPKFLAAHAWGSETGRPTSIGRWIDINIDKDAVTGTAQFLDAGDDLADPWWTRFEQGVTNTFSIGFIVNPNGYEFREVDVDGDKKRIRHFTQATLVEVSAVEIPANPDAVVRQYKAASSDLDYTALAENLMGSGLSDAIKQQINKVLTDPFGPMESVREFIAEFRADGSSGHDRAPIVTLDPKVDRAALTRELKQMLGSA